MKLTPLRHKEHISRNPDRLFGEWTTQRLDSAVMNTYLSRRRENSFLD
jgi:hypothetical protein